MCLFRHFLHAESSVVHDQFSDSAFYGCSLHETSQEGVTAAQALCMSVHLACFFQAVCPLNFKHRRQWQLLAACTCRVHPCICVCLFCVSGLHFSKCCRSKSRVSVAFMSHKAPVRPQICSPECRSQPGAVLFLNPLCSFKYTFVLCVT